MLIWKLRSDFLRVLFPTSKFLFLGHAFCLWVPYSGRYKAPLISSPVLGAIRSLNSGIRLLVLESNGCLKYVSLPSRNLWGNLGRETRTLVSAA